MSDATPRILGLITARGGSKGVPRKNLRQIGGLSLIGYKARAVAAAACCQRLILSSDDEEILAEGRRHGAETPFTRPSELASDTASSDDVVLHAMDFVETEEGRPYDAVLLLEPSSPFATPDHLHRATDLWQQHTASLIVGMRRAHPPSALIGPLDPDGRASRLVRQFAVREGVRRQDFEPEYTMNGALYLVRWESLRRTGRIYGDPDRTFGLVMDEAHSCSIDTPLDLALAELLVSRGLVNRSTWCR